MGVCVVETDFKTISQIWGTFEGHLGNAKYDTYDEQTYHLTDRSLGAACLSLKSEKQDSSQGSSFRK